MEDETFTGLLMVIVFLLAISVFSLIFIGPIYERKHYIELTGVEVSYLDAFFMELDPSKHVVKLEENAKYNQSLEPTNTTEPSLKIE